MLVLYNTKAAHVVFYNRIRRSARESYTEFIEKFEGVYANNKMEIYPKEDYIKLRKEVIEERKSLLGKISRSMRNIRSAEHLSSEQKECYFWQMHSRLRNVHDREPD